MPISYHESYEPYKDWIKKNQPKTLLDIGMGFGNIGGMAKNIIPELDMTGLEIFLPYLYEKFDPANRNIKRYNKIIIANVLDMINKLWEFDVITAFDVIEHLKREDGIRTIKYLTSIAKISLLVCVPIITYGQNPIHGNEHERHLDQWSAEEMRDIGGTPLLEGKVLGLYEFKKNNITKEKENL